MTPLRVALLAMILLGAALWSLRAHQARDEARASLRDLAEARLQASLQRAEAAPAEIVEHQGRRVEIVESSYPFTTFPESATTPSVWLVQRVVRLRTLDGPRVQYQALGLVQALRPPAETLPDSETLPPVRR